MRIVVLVLGLVLSGCTYTAQVSPSTSAAGEILPQKQSPYVASYYVSPDVASLTRDASEGYVCSAHNFPVNAGPAIASSIRSINDTAFKSATQGGAINQAAEGAERHLVYELDTFNARLHFEQGFWSGTAVANVELALKITGYDDSGTEVLRTVVSGTGYAEDEGGCEAGAQALSVATNQAIKRTMESYVNRVINAEQI